MPGFDRRLYMEEHWLPYALTPTTTIGVFNVLWDKDYLANREGEVDLPEQVRCEMEVCGTCSGHGKVVDPRIDSACTALACSDDPRELVRVALEHWDSIGWPEDRGPIALLQRALAVLSC